MTEERKKALVEFCAKQGLTSVKLDILHLALTHKSFANELPEFANPQLRENLHNQRLEFLGDSILNLVIAENLYHNYPLLSEGELTKRKSRAVCEPTLFEIAEQLQLEKLLLQGKGERQSQKSRAMLADALEAVIAAIFLSCGFEAARNFILPLWEPYLKEEVMVLDSLDYKSWLQVYLAQKCRQRPEYRIVSSSGPEHRRIFEVSLFIDGKEQAKGVSSSRKRAEQQAAKAYIEQHGLKGPASH